MFVVFGFDCNAILLLRLTEELYTRTTSLGRHMDLTAVGGRGSICPGAVESRGEPDGVVGQTTLRRFTRMIVNVTRSAMCCVCQIK